MFVPRRLNKFLREATGLSARRVERLWAEGAVRVHSRPVGQADRVHDSTGLESLVFEEDVVTVRGVKVAPRRAHATMAFNKPRAVTSTVKDPTGKRDLSVYMTDMPKGTFPIGRLDRDTTGLLLFTTDGDLCNALLRPEHHTDKLYWLWLDGRLSDDDPRLRTLTDGVDIAERRVRAKHVVIQHRTPDFTELQVTLDEGRNRQIRRMCRALDLHLVHLHRKRVGHVTLEGVPQGSARRLRSDEVERLWQSTGGRELVIRRQIAALERKSCVYRESGRPDERLERWLERCRRASKIGR